MNYEFQMDLRKSSRFDKIINSLAGVWILKLKINFKHISPASSKQQTYWIEFSTNFKNILAPSKQQTNSRGSEHLKENIVILECFVEIEEKLEKS